MSTFKKAFRGYRKAEVDQRFRELQSQVDAMKARCVRLESQLAQAQQTAREAQDALVHQEAELNQVRKAYDEACLQTSRQFNEAEAIGRVYIKAFESGREIATAPQQHVEKFLAGIEGTTTAARGHIGHARDQFAAIAKHLSDMVSAIQAQAEGVRQTVQALSAEVDEVDQAYARFDEVKAQTQADIDDIRHAYEMVLRDYTGYPAESRPPVHAHEQERPVPHPEAERVTMFALDSASVPEQQRDETSTDSQQADEKTVEKQLVADVQPVNAAGESGSQAEEVAVPTDTADDFRDDTGAKVDFSAYGSPEEEDPKDASSSHDDVAVNGEAVVRGQNILQLLNKYKRS